MNHYCTVVYTGLPTGRNHVFLALLQVLRKSPDQSDQSAAIDWHRLF